MKPTSKQYRKAARIIRNQAQEYACNAIYLAVTGTFRVDVDNPYADEFTSMFKPTFASEASAWLDAVTSTEETPIWRQRREYRQACRETALLFMAEIAKSEGR